MKSIPLRTGSFPIQSTVRSGSPKISLTRYDSQTNIFSGVSSPRNSLHLDINHHRKGAPIRRALSDSDVIRSEREASRGLKKPSGAGSRSCPSMIPEVEEHVFGDRVDDYADIWPKSGIPLEELGSSGDGFGKSDGGHRGSGGNDWRNGDDVSKMGDYYKQMLKSNPNDALILRNYGKYLHEVEGDAEKAEEYYGRAILASPGDGEVLSLYGKLIWDEKRDGERAKSYFDQAVIASPNDCMVLGSYASFMWEAEEDDDEEVEDKSGVSSAAAMVAAF
ncbi:hypothetical protein OIU84_022546 [Salix udensis]|uniref:TmcB/TmcC TPR repeats domain-containing protein n=1 Tax=Salix udensis TaxID=889485 RepID=A0AAD6KP57_9ROSI|nr:hypothetical protein OIU84_022546 [Salix udensis]